MSFQSHIIKILKIHPGKFVQQEHCRLFPVQVGSWSCSNRETKDAKCIHWIDWYGKIDSHFAVPTCCCNPDQHLSWFTVLSFHSTKHLTYSPSPFVGTGHPADDWATKWLMSSTAHCWTCSKWPGASRALVKRIRCAGVDKANTGTWECVWGVQEGRSPLHKSSTWQERQQTQASCRLYRRRRFLGMERALLLKTLLWKQNLN